MLMAPSLSQPHMRSGVLDISRSPGGAGAPGDIRDAARGCGTELLPALGCGAAPDLSDIKVSLELEGRERGRRREQHHLGPLG